MSNAGNAAKHAENTSPGPWSKWKGTRVERFIKFAQSYLRLPRGSGFGEPIKLLPWQLEFVEQYWADGVTAGGLVMGRGGGKSTFIAALAAFNLFEDNPMGSPYIPIVGTSLQAAKDAIYGQIVSMIHAEPELESRTLIFSGMGTERILFPRNGGVIVPRSADKSTLQGMDVTDGYVDEWGHLPVETWNAVLMGRKRAGSRVMGAGTPGPDILTPLYQIRKQIKDGGAISSFHYKEFSGKPGVSVLDEENWKLGNPSLEYGFPDIAFLRDDAITTPESLFRTYRLAEFNVVGHNSWLGTDAITIWDSLEEPYEFIDKAPTFVGVDIGIVNDSSAVVALQKRPDGRYHAKAKIWMPTPGELVDIEEVMGYLRDLHAKYAVKAISYDKSLFQLGAQHLFNEGLKMVEIPQSIERMTPIIRSLSELIRPGKDKTPGLTHDRDDMFSQQVVNAVPQLNQRGYTLSKSKSAPRGHIDACIALALGADRALWADKPTTKLVVAWI